jgi:hypothetical protein
MNAETKLDAAVGRQVGVALDEARLHLDRVAHGIDHAAEYDENAVAGALDDAPARYQLPETKHYLPRGQGL